MIWLAVFPTLTVLNLALGDWLKTLSPVAAHLRARHHRGADRHLRPDAAPAPAPRAPDGDEGKARCAEEPTMLMARRDTNIQAAHALCTLVDFACRASEDCAACSSRREDLR